MSVFTFIYNGPETFLKHALVYDQDQSGLSGLTSLSNGVDEIRPTLHALHGTSWLRGTGAEEE
jgi:hypothetical protein